MNAFKLWCWRWLLRVPWTARRSNQSILKEINHSYSMELLLKDIAEAEALKLWPPDAKRLLIGKDPDAGEGWGQEKRVTEDEMVGWRHWLNGYEFEQAPGDSEGQGSLACCSPWSHNKSLEQQSLWTTTNLLVLLRWRTLTNTVTIKHSKKEHQTNIRNWKRQEGILACKVHTLILEF